MRFGMIVAAAAALVCAGQADAARYYEFDLKGYAYFAASPFVGDGVHAYNYDIDYHFVFDTLVAGAPRPAIGVYSANGYDDGVTLDVRDPASPMIQDYATPFGPEFSFSFDFAKVATGSALSPLAISNNFLNYRYQVDPRYSNYVNATAGGIISVTARTSDVSPGFTGLIQNVTVTAVPEPATWALMILGVAAIGYSTRRRKVSFAII